MGNSAMDDREGSDIGSRGLFLVQELEGASSGEGKTPRVCLSPDKSHLTRDSPGGLNLSIPAMVCG